jgi:8-oxo-dGTP pyrophosphatase MutT (NUDIX family)
MNIDPRIPKIKDCLYRVAVKAIIQKNGKYLLVRDKRDTGWSFPGGGVDYGENLQQALVREIAEEINIPESAISSDFKIIDTNIGQEKDGIPRCNLHFIVTISNNLAQETSEIEEFGWFTLNEFKNLPIEQSAGDIYKTAQLAAKL